MNIFKWGVIPILYVEFKVGNTVAWLEVLCVTSTWLWVEVSMQQKKEKKNSCGTYTSIIHSVECLFKTEF